MNLVICSNASKCPDIECVPVQESTNPDQPNLKVIQDFLDNHINLNEYVDALFLETLNELEEDHKTEFNVRLKMIKEVDNITRNLVDALMKRINERQIEVKKEFTLTFK